MTEVQTTLRSAYLAGPMRGYEDFNFPAFRAASSWLRDKGWRIYSPAERDEADPMIPSNQELRNQGHDWSGTHGLDFFMTFDLPAVCSHDAVICLPGWEESQGARLETMVAIEVGHPVFEITGPSGMRILQMGDTTKGWQLTHVEPDYVRAIFAIKSLEFVYDHVGDLGFERPSDFNVGLPVDLPEQDGLKEESLEMIRQYEFEPKRTSAVPSESAARKGVPLTTGVLDYFPAALAEVAKVSKAGNDKHNPGQPLHHARSKSTDHADSLLRHLIDRGSIDPDTGCRHSAEAAWRALALLQEELEEEGLAPLARGAKL